MKQSSMLFKSEFESKARLETEVDKIKNHLTPIIGYAELILSGKMGAITVRQRKNIEVIRSEAKRMNFLLKTYKKEYAAKSSFIKNEIAKLGLKLDLSKKEIKEKTRQIKHLKKEKTGHHFMREGKKPFRNDINKISSQITTVQNQVNKNARKVTIIIDEDLKRKLRSNQVKLTRKSTRAASFSKTVNDYLRKGLDEKRSS